MTLTEQMTQLAQSNPRLHHANFALLTTAEKRGHTCLFAMADALEQNADAIKAANALFDMEVGTKLGLSSAMLDRLKLDDKRIARHGQGSARSGGFTA